MEDKLLLEMLFHYLYKSCYSIGKLKCMSCVVCVVTFSYIPNESFNVVYLLSFLLFPNEFV